MPYFNFKSKKIYYYLKGNPDKPAVLLLHGNTASSKMFKGINSLKSDFYLIGIDFPGHGKSERLSSFPADFWYENALCSIELLKHLNLEKVHLLGSSGGAIVALNIALIAPDLVDKIIADSFEGELPFKSYVDSAEEEREEGKKSLKLRFFWWYMHGKDWRFVVDSDTDMLKRHYEQVGKFYHEDLAKLTCEVLLTGSLEDEFLKDYIQDIYEKLSAKIQNSKVLFFKSGGHPALFSNKKAMIKAVKNFLLD